jgi:two-component system response regulator YesN
VTIRGDRPQGIPHEGRDGCGLLSTVGGGRIQVYKVLVVDDDRVILRDIIANADWAGCGFEITGQARDGVEAMAQIEAARPDVVITDICMPRMDGVELIRAASARWPGMSFVVLSNYDDFGYVRKALRCGAFDYLLKYEVNRCELTALLNKVRVRLEGAGAARPNAPPQTVLPNCRAEIHRAERYMRDNLTRCLSLAEVARHVALSKHYFCRLFREQTGHGFVEHLNLLRVECAKEYLLKTRLCQKEILGLVGFSNYNYYCEVFKRAEGMTPVEYRQRRQGDVVV